MHLAFKLKAQAAAVTGSLQNQRTCLNRFWKVD